MDIHRQLELLEIIKSAMSANSPDRIQVEIDRLTMIKNTPPMFGIDDVKYVKESKRSFTPNVLGTICSCW